MRVYALKTCDTCRRALAEIRAKGHDPAVTDVRADGLEPAEIARFLDAFGAALVNRSSATWRKLSEEERARDPAALIAEFPTVMKRPVIEVDSRLYLGWTADVKQAVLG